MSEITYQLSQKLAEGLLYTAYRGIAHLPNGNQRDVVLKQIHAHLLQDGVLSAHLAGFADVYRGLSHTGLAPIWTFGKHQDDVFLVREYLPGISLQYLFSLVQRNEAALSPAMAIYLTQEITDAISSIHRYRVPGDKPIYLFHGGLAPENVILTRLGNVVVTDAGLDVIFWRNSDLAWRLRQRKQPYHPPEYASGERPMRRGDGYGVAALLYQMVMGTTLHEACRQAGGVPFVAPSTHHARITAQFDQFIYACLHPDIEQRLVQMKDIQQALRQPGLLSQETMQPREAMAYLEVLVSEALPRQSARSTDVPFKGKFALESLLPERDDIPPPEERYRPPVYDSTDSFHPTQSPAEVFAPRTQGLSIGAMEPLHDSSGMGGETAASPAPPPALGETKTLEDELSDELEPPLHGERTPEKTDVLDISAMVEDEDSSHHMLDEDEQEMGEATTLEPASLAALAPVDGKPPAMPMQPAKLPPAPLGNPFEVADAPESSGPSAEDKDDDKDAIKASALGDFVVEEVDEDPAEVTTFGPAEIEAPPDAAPGLSSADQILSNILDDNLDESLALGGEQLQKILDEVEEAADQPLTARVEGRTTEATTPSGSRPPRRQQVVVDDGEDEDLDDEGETAQRPRAQIIMENAETRLGEDPRLHDPLVDDAIADESLLQPPDDESDAPPSAGTDVASQAELMGVDGKEEEEYTGELEALGVEDAIELIEDDEPDDLPENTAQSLTPASLHSPLGHHDAATSQALHPATDEHPATPLPMMAARSLPPQGMPETVALPSEQVPGMPGHPQANGPQGGQPLPARLPTGSLAEPQGGLPPQGMPETVALPLEQVTPSPTPAPAFAHTPSPTPLAPGQERFGKFVLLNRVALGGMAEVFRAKFAGPGGFQKVVAIKRILPEYSQDVNFTQMFMDEARIAGSLRHPNIVQILELGAIEGVFFISMEYIDGIDLARVIKIRRALQETIPLEIILDIGIAVCRALDYAHSECDPDGRPLQMIHRDVTPHNILISKKGECKLTDFGIAKAAQNVAETAVGELKGKISYMSPEQAEGITLDARSDIFQVGIVLYEMLTLRKMFEGNSDQSILNKIQNAQFAPPRRVLSGVPKNIEQVVMRALATDKEERYQTSAELQKALFQCRHQLKVKDPLDVAEFAKEILVQRDELLAQHAAARRQQVQQHAFNRLHPQPAQQPQPPQPAPPLGAPAALHQEPPPEDEASGPRTPWGKNKLLVLMVVLMLAAGLIVGALLMSRKPEPKFVFLTVHTNPAGAAVLLDGTLLGKTPLFEKKLPFDKESHTLRLQRDGFKVFSHTFHFSIPNETKRVPVLLQRLPARRPPSKAGGPVVPRQIRPLPMPSNKKIPNQLKKKSP